jgi:Tectonin domain
MGKGCEMKTTTSVLIALALLVPGASFAQTGDAWHQVPGLAKDIGVGANGSVWIIGTNPSATPDDFGAHRWTGTDWHGVEGGGVRIDVDPSGNPWMINSKDEIFRRVNDTWERVPGSAQDVGVGADGSVWIIGTNPSATPDDFGAHKWTGKDWQGVEGGGVRIDVDPSGNPWMVNSKGEIFRRVNDTWQRVPGSAKDVGVGADGSVWIIGTNPSEPADNFGVHRWTGKDWFGVEGGGVQISVDKSGLPWMVNAAGNIFIRK